jgi:hypothetical protein
MTKAQQARLHTILGKLENLEHIVRDSEIKERLHAGKNELLEALNLADRNYC